MDTSDGPNRRGYGGDRNRERPYDNRRPDDGKRGRGNHQFNDRYHYHRGGGGGGRFYHDLDDFSSSGRRDGRGGNYRRGGRSYQRGSWGRQNNSGGSNAGSSHGKRRPAQREQLPEDVAQLTELIASDEQMKVTAMSLDSEKQQLYTGSKDGKVKVWSFETGQCTANVDVGGEVDSIMVECGFLIVGLHDKGNEGIIKVWNMATGAEHKLTGHKGQVLCLAAGNNCLYSGGQDSSIRVWAFNTQAAIFLSQDILTAQNNGHAKAVACITLTGPFLFSGDFGGWIKVWDISQPQVRCLQTVQSAHQSAITKMLFFEEKYLMSASLDGTLKVWGPRENPIAGVVLEQEPMYKHESFDDDEDGHQGGRPRHQQSKGILTMHGTADAAHNPIIMVSLLHRHAVKMYSLPNFEYRGTLHQHADVLAITTVPGKIMMTGDDKGKLKVFQWKGAQFSPRQEAAMA